MRQILKQTSWLILAQILTKIIGFFYTIFLARKLGVENFGLLTLALADYSIVSSIADFGFNRYLIREVAKDKLKSSELLCNVAMLRLTLTAVLFGIFAVFLYLLDPDKTRVSLILMAQLAILPQSAALTFDGIFIALQKLQLSAVALIISSLSTAILGFYLVTSGFGAVGVVNALIIGQVLYALSLLIFLLNKKILPLNIVTFQTLKTILAGSLPYGLLGILGLLYFKIDTVILGYLKGNYETGLYGVAYKFLEAIIFVPSAFAAALFPALVKLESNSEIKKIYFRSLKLMAVLGCLALGAYLIFLPIVIRLFLPNYLKAIPAIRILSLSIPFIFLATPGVQLMLSTDKYLKEVIFFSIFTVMFNVVLNFLFIPQFGFLAASSITVLSDILSFVIFFLFIKFKIVPKK